MRARARARASASREFTFVREGEKKRGEPRRDKCAVPRTKKRIIKNFSPSPNPEKARARSFARVGPTLAPGTNHTATG